MQDDMERIVNAVLIAARNGDKMAAKIIPLRIKKSIPKTVRALGPAHAITESGRNFLREKDFDAGLLQGGAIKRLSPHSPDSVIFGRAKGAIQL
jgi:hypothetical protein